MKKKLTVIFLTFMCSNLLLSQVKHSILNVKFNLPKEAIRIDTTFIDKNNKTESRMTNLKNIYKINKIFIGFNDLEYGYVPKDVLDIQKGIQESLVEIMEGAMETKSEILTINNNKVLIFYDNFENDAGYYFVVVKSDFKQVFAGYFGFQNQPDYAQATKILYDLLNSVKWPFINNPQSGKFKKTNCGTGESIAESEYIVPAGTYSSSISQLDADNQAKADVAKNGQKYANAKGTCK